MSRVIMCLGLEWGNILQWIVGLGGEFGRVGLVYGDFEGSGVVVGLDLGFFGYVIEGYQVKDFDVGVRMFR